MSTITTYWGVDSFDSASSTVSGTGRTLFDYVTQQLGQAPAFWGRYLVGQPFITVNEADFLHGRGCKIALLYNGLSGAAVAGTRQGGGADAVSAVDALQSLGVPANQGIAVFANIEADWSPSSDRIQGWADYFHNTIQGAYLAGYYADTAESAFTGPYCLAFSSDPVSMPSTYIWASEPQTADCTSAATAPPFNPDTPSCNVANTAVWQYHINCLPDPGNPTQYLIDEDEATSPGLALMW